MKDYEVEEQSPVASQSRGESYQQQEAVLQVLVGLDAAVLWPLVVQRPRGVEEGDVSVPAGAEVNLLQLQLVGRVQGSAQGSTAPCRT